MVQLGKVRTNQNPDRMPSPAGIRGLAAGRGTRGFMRRVLGIETSCDDTSAAVVLDGREVLSNVIAAQDVHRDFGGVVPELASRAHLDLLVPTVEQALAGAGIGFDGLDAIAVTRGPGLVGSLLVGISYAKALATSLELPLVGVNHIEGHLLASLLEGAAPRYPALGVVVSGGHSEILLVRAIGDYTLLGTTRDDAIGEAFDKVAKLLGLGFPGGPVIDRLSEEGREDRFEFPRGMATSGDYDLSFSGLKTAVRQAVDRERPPLAASWIADVCASFQAAAVDSLMLKVERATDAYAVRSVLVGGGVAANRRLRGELERLSSRRGLPVFLASPRLCADNAAMIALVGALRLERGERHGSDLEPIPNFEDTGLVQPLASVGP